MRQKKQFTAADHKLLSRVVDGRAVFPRFRVSDGVYNRLYNLERRGLVDMSNPAETVATDAGRAALEGGTR